MYRILKAAGELRLGGHQVGGDLVPVEAAILNKDLVGAGAGNDDAGQVDSGDVAFQSVRIADGQLVGAMEMDAEALKDAQAYMQYLYGRYAGL